jgi:hypothetical protein
MGQRGNGLSNSPSMGGGPSIRMAAERCLAVACHMDVAAVDRCRLAISRIDTTASRWDLAASLVANRVDSTSAVWPEAN